MREENYPVPPTDQGTAPHGTNRRALLTGTALTAVDCRSRYTRQLRYRAEAERQ